MRGRGWHYASVDAVRQEAGVADQSDECPNGRLDCPDANGLPCLECFLEAESEGEGDRRVATDGGTETVEPSQDSGTDLEPIRVYPNEYDCGADVPNTIFHDLRGTWGWRAVALHGEDGGIVEWYAHRDDVFEWWPDFYDDPVWRASSIYAFTHPAVEDGDGYYALYEWPDELDEDAEVVA